MPVISTLKRGSGKGRYSIKFISVENRQVLSLSLSLSLFSLSSRVKCGLFGRMRSYSSWREVMASGNPKAFISSDSLRYFSDFVKIQRNLVSLDIDCFHYVDLDAFREAMKVLGVYATRLRRLSLRFVPPRSEVLLAFCGFFSGAATLRF